MARANRLSGLRGGGRLGLGQDSSIDWGSVLNNTISTAGAVAAKAVTPPTYSAVINPLTGAQTITSYGATVPSTSLLGTTDLSTLLESPLVLFGGLALVAFLMLKN